MEPDRLLPPGKHCGDCHWFHRCQMLFGCNRANNFCDWGPSRFRPTDNPEFLSSSGQCECHLCGKLYVDHPAAAEYPGYDGSLPLTRLCDGTLVKL